MASPNDKHGWFAIPGVQTGERDIAERVGPLKALTRWKIRTVLDVGCAEGLIGKWLMDEGSATFVHGLEAYVPYLETARQIMPPNKYRTLFEVVDLDNFDEVRPSLHLMSAYDCVLCLNIIQKLKKPRKFLLDMAALSRDVFVYSGPAKVLSDWRSNNKPVDIERELHRDFQLVQFHSGQMDDVKGHLGVRMIFRRRVVVERIRARARAKGKA